MERQPLAGLCDNRQPVIFILYGAESGMEFTNELVHWIPTLAHSAGHPCLGFSSSFQIERRNVAVGLLPVTDWPIWASLRDLARAVALVHCRLRARPLPL